MSTAVSLDGKRKFPLTTASGIVGGIATVVAFLVSLAVLPAADGDAVNTAANYLVPAAFGVVATVHTLVVHFTAKSKTTPANDPRAAVVQPDGTTKLEPMVAISLATNPYAAPGQAAPGASAPGDDFSDVPV